MSRIAADQIPPGGQADSANHPAPTRTALSDAAWRKRLDAIAADARMHDRNITLPASSAAKVSRPMLVVGVAFLVVSAIGAFSISFRHALAGLEIGVFTALAISLGSFFWVMVFHALNAGWPVTIRRQLENIGSLVWLPWLAILIIGIVEVASGGVLLEWLDPATREGNYLINKKAPYLNGPFFIVRILIYGVVWISLARVLLAWSRRADETGDRTLGRKSRFWSSLGIPFFALATSFCAFDFLMSLDYRFFSTMWGVYYFASCALGGLATVALVTSMLRAAGRLQGLITEEHYHDLGKLIFGFTVFWAYISFSQYFLIWYSNIPEETMWFTARNTGGWQWLFLTLAFGHFVAPFLILIFRGVKRSPRFLSIMSAFLIVMIALDMAYIILPMISIGHPESTTVPGMLIHVAGALGVLFVFGWFVCGKITKSPLIPTKDPMLHEAMKHKNYV